MSEIKARQSIPFAWAEQGHCPVCFAPQLQVQHQTAAPDQLRCAACGVAFEVELDGARLHVTHWPDSYAVLRETTADHWSTVAELRALIQQSVSASAMPAPISPAAPTRPPVMPPKNGPDAQTQDGVGGAIRAQSSSQKTNRSAPNLSEMALRVKKLRDLGNTPMQIRAILRQSGIELEQIQAALDMAGRMERQEQGRQQKKLWLSLGVLGVILVICLGTGIILQKMYSNQQTQVVSSLQATLVPDLAKILKLNTPVVQYPVAPPGYSSGGVKGCPRTPEEAAALFGGQPAKWSSPPGTNGWIMINVGQGATLYIPNGMKAAYLQLGNSVKLVEVSGPATLSNVYYLAVSCP